MSVCWELGWDIGCAYFSYPFHENIFKLLWLDLRHALRNEKKQLINNIYIVWMTGASGSHLLVAGGDLQVGSIIGPNWKQVVRVTSRMDLRGMCAWLGSSQKLCGVENLVKEWTSWRLCNVSSMAEHLNKIESQHHLRCGYEKYKVLI